MTYKDLKSFQQASIIYDFTVEFCTRYIDPKSRTTDQMTQAARSGKQNITEGSSVSKTWPQTELKLVGVARGSLKELLEDYEDFLRQKGLEKWEKDDPRAIEARQLAYHDRSDKTDRSYKTYKSYEFYLPDPEKAANAMITLINQTTYLLDKQMQAIERQMQERGISNETQEQRAARILKDQKHKNQKFNEILKEIQAGTKTAKDLYDL